MPNRVDLLINQNATVTSPAPRFEDHTQFQLDVIAADFITLLWEISNVTPEARDVGGQTISAAAFSPQDADFITYKTITAAGFYYFNGAGRYHRVRLTSGSGVTVRISGFAFNEAVLFG